MRAIYIEPMENIPCFAFALLYQSRYKTGEVQIFKFRITLLSRAQIILEQFFETLSEMKRALVIIMEAEGYLRFLDFCFIFCNYCFWDTR